jgi:hypothetical protein
MLTLKSSHYTKEDYEYLLRIVVSGQCYCVNVRQLSLDECEKCLHSLACRDLQHLAMYCRKKLMSNID